MYVCVWGRNVSIIPINHPLPASVSSWYVGELWESLITHTHTGTHGHTQAHTLHHYCQQLPSRPCEYPNNIIITSILQQCAPFQSPWPFAPQGTKRNRTSLPGLIPHNRTIGPSTPPALHTTELTFDPRGRVREKSGRAPVSGRWLGG